MSSNLYSPKAHTPLQHEISPEQFGHSFLILSNQSCSKENVRLIYKYANITGGLNKFDTVYIKKQNKMEK